MKPSVQILVRRSRNPRSADSLVRGNLTTQCNARTWLSALPSISTFPKPAIAAVLLFLLAVANSAFSAIPTVEVPVKAWAWMKRNGTIVTNSGGERDEAIAVVVDARGDIIVTGTSSAPFDSQSEDILTIKYSGHDGSVVWSRRHDSGAGSHDFATGLAVDLEGNVVLTGSSFTQASWPNHDSYIAKYAAADGAVLWEQRFTFPGENNYQPRMVTVDATENAVVLGRSLYAEQTNSYVVKYAAKDGSLLWGKQITNATVEALSVDTGDRVVVAGFSGDWDNADLYAAKFGATDGALLWERRYDGAAHRRDWARAVAVDIEGNVIVAGSSENSTDSDFYTAKYAASDGTLLWETTYNGRARTNDTLWAVAVDTMGNVVVAGYSGNWPNVQSYWAKYRAADGHLLWEQHYNDPTNGVLTPYVVTVDAPGNVIVTGSRSSTNDNFDYYTAKYAATDGKLLWEQRYNGRPADRSDSVAIDANGNVVVTGRLYVGQWSSDYYTAKYAAADGEVLWEQQYDGPVLSVVGDAIVPRAVAIDPRGDVVLSSGSTDQSNPTSYTAKYAGSNGMLIWEQRTNSFDARAMALDSSGNVFVTGCNSQPFQDEFCRTVKYAAADGSILWEQEHGGDALVVDQSDNVVVTRCSRPFDGSLIICRTVKLAAADGAMLWELEQGGAIAVDKSGNVVLVSGGYIVKHAAEDGSLLWEKSGPADSNLAAVAVDGNGNVVVTGRAPTPGPCFFNCDDCYTAKYASADGTLLWERFYFDNAGWTITDDAGRAIAIDSADDVVVTGYSSYHTPFGGGVLGAAHITIKYSGEDGTLLWDNRYFRRDLNIGWAVAFDSKNNVVVAATASITSCGQGGCSVGPSEMYTVKYSAAEGELLWELQGNGASLVGGGDGAAIALARDGSIVIAGSPGGNPGPEDDYDMVIVKHVMTRVTYPTPVVLLLAITPEGARLRFAGDPGRTYRLQRASDPVGPWTTFATLTVPPDGAVEHLDTAPLSSPAFYRVAAP